MIKVLVLFISYVFVVHANDFRYRKYEHVKNFYAPIAKDIVRYGIKHNIPPAAIMAIAGVESGYGRGYVAQITGNILSLGAGKSDKELPALTLPSPKNDPQLILYDPKEINSYKKSELLFKKHPASLKKDYRPAPYAGTTQKLYYFKDHPKQRLEANMACVYDFCTKWISYDNSHKPFREAREKMDKLVRQKGKKALLSYQAAKEFIYSVGGKKNSFNYRVSWPKRVLAVMKHAGLVELSQELHAGKSFQESWINR